MLANILCTPVLHFFHYHQYQVANQNLSWLIKILQSLLYLVFSNIFSNQRKFTIARSAKYSVMDILQQSLDSNPFKEILIASLLLVGVRNSKKSRSIISKKINFNSDPSCKIITPPLPSAFNKDNFWFSSIQLALLLYLTIVKSPYSGTYRSSSFSLANRNRGGSISKRGNTRKSSISREKQKELGRMPNDLNKNRDRRDSDGEKERDRLVVKARQRTAIACNYCRRRKVFSLFFFFLPN